MRAWLKRLFGLDKPVEAPAVIVSGDKRTDVRAVVIGLTKYEHLQPDLPGPVDDAGDVVDLLMHTYHVPAANIVTLFDRAATWSNKYDALARALHDTKAHESLWISQASHGTQGPDADGDEADALDEICCMYDFDWGNRASWWVDDDYRRLFKALRPEAFLTVIHDTCHSGTMTRAACPTRFVTPPEEIAEMIHCRDLPVNHLAVREDGEPQRHLSLAACRDDQVANGFWHPKYPKSRGVFTYSLTKAMREAPLMSWNSLYGRLAPFCLAHRQDPVMGGMAALTARAPFQRET